MEYLGFAVMAVTVACLVVARRRAAWVMAAIVVVCTVLSWGIFLWLSPKHAIFTKWLPWYWLANRPVFTNISTNHFAAFADLGVALIVAMGLAAFRYSPLWARLAAPIGSIVVVGVAAALLLPTWFLFQVPLNVHRVDAPPWFTTAALHVREGSVVVTYPFPDSAALTSEPMVWQAADDMRFRLAGGYVKVPAARGLSVVGLGLPGSAVRTLIELTSQPTFANPTGHQMDTMRRALRQWSTSYIVVTNTGLAPVMAAAVFTAATGIVPRISHRAWVWDLGTTPVHGPYDGQSAASAFATCRHRIIGYGAVPSGRPLPQDVNTCVAGAASKG
jgi:hypothetical protein